ncbi:MAG: thioredoxin domain-containing protein [Oscillospiraceae bacterium]|nr:thioredoxin domain-containing protein [Oscillospiraceae bacterium]
MPTTDQVPNRLAKEKSPYLLQHAYNPVNWYSWGSEAFETAKKEDKPIFLSIGYSTCHWCHVMAHESFENQTVAAILNRDFICIKVDREERPDIDAVYMKACQSMTGSGGWPLTIIMTDDQRPFFAATYLPRSSRYGMAGLLELLPEIARQWRDNRDEIEAVGEKISNHLRALSASTVSSSAPGRYLIDNAVRDFQNRFDADYGGFGDAPKFPSPHNLLLLLRHAALEQDESCRSMAEKTLAQMYRGGIFDHIGGGFSRYSTDRKWLIPHFEKMLYDNALLSMAYTEAYRLTRKPLWERVARKTLDYVLRELTHPAGGFYCAQDADSEGKEGKYYAWTPAEIERILGADDAKTFCAWFDITPQGNFEGKNIPNLLSNPNWENDPLSMENACRKLYAYRVERARLHKDDKILTSWNALMIAALAKAGGALHEPRYLQAAEKAHAFICANLMREKRLFVRWRDGEAAHDGQLDDYAFYAFALLALYETTFNPAYLQECTQIAKQMLQMFFDSANGGFYFYSADSETLIDRPKEVYDGAMPSGNSMAAIVLGQLMNLTGEPQWQEASDAQLCFLAGATGDYPAAFGASLLAMQKSALYPSEDLLCVTSENDVPAVLFTFLSAQYRPNLTVLVKTLANAKILETAVPFTKDYPIPSRGTAYYLCHNGVCAQPVYDIGSLRALL